MVRRFCRNTWWAAVLTAGVLISNAAVAGEETAGTPNEGVAGSSGESVSGTAKTEDVAKTPSSEAVPQAAAMPAPEAGSTTPVGTLMSAPVDFGSPATAANMSPMPQETKSEFDDVSLSQLLDVSVVASKRAETIADAPSSITVFTAEKIHALGLRTLDDVLQLVPGFDVRRGRQQLELITVRGITSDLNERLLIMMDGVRLGSLNDGGTGKTVRALNLTDVQRIEIIRGPGSALYGSNAFAAVVSIITKKGSDVEAVHVASEIGSYAGRTVDVTAGKKFGDIDANGHFGYAASRGESFHVYADGAGQSGNIRDPYNELTGNLKLGYKDMLQLNVSGAHQVNSAFITVGDVMDPNSSEKSTWLVSSLDFHLDFSKVLKWQTQANMAYMDWGPITALLLPGGLNPAFSNGQYAHPHSRDYRYGIDSYVNYEPIRHLNLTAGGAAEIITTDDSDRVSNGPDASAIKPAKFYNNPNRSVLAAYAQGDYQFIKGLKLTAGVRHDQYNDFGGTTNPRVALVYNYRDKAWAKALFATAFRAPSYREMWSQNNPVINGDPNNKAETIKTGELVLGVAPWRKLTATVSFFDSKIDNMIYISPTATPGKFLYQNNGTLTSWGAEGEIKTDFVPGIELAGNYTYAHAENTVFGHTYTAPLVARHAANFTISRDLYHHLRLSVLGEYRSSRARYVLAGDPKSDPRPPVGEVLLIGAYAKIYDLAEGVSGFVRVSNILDRQYVEPSTYPAKVAGVTPDDIHNRGFEVQGGLTYSFK